MGRRKKFAVMKLSDMEVEQIKIDPVAAGERLRVKLGMEVDEKLRDLNNAVGEESTSSALLAALQAWRIFYGFSHALAEATGRRVYEVRWSLHERMPNDYLKRRLQAIRGSALPTVELPALGLKILKAIEAQPKSGPTIFQGEAEYQAWLESKGLVEGDPQGGYVSRTKVPRSPSPE